ncbi:MAG: hypothetical protein JNK82_36685, partial [Myxococcaceae bacterium]|nr:hypothetical protein [Myxococcaceae bacterium]
MRSLALFAFAAMVVSSCSCGRSPKLGGLLADVRRAPGVKVSCVTLKVTATRGGEELGSKTLAFEAKDQLQIGIGSEGWPREVTLTATPLWSADGCTDAKVNGAPVEKAVEFPASGVETVRLDLELPPATVDVDRDGFVPLSSGGLDCDDLNALAFPGAVESCQSLADLDCDRQAGCADTQCANVPGCAQPADRFVFTSPSRTVEAGACSPEVTFESRNSMGGAQLAPGTVVSLVAAPAGAKFFTDAACTQEVTSLTAASGQLMFRFYFSAMTPGMFDATVSAPGISATSQPETVTPPPATRLVFVTPARTVQAGSCSSALDVEAQNLAGQPSPVMAATTVELTVLPSSAVTFHLDPMCTTAAVTSAPIAAQAARSTFYVRGLMAGAPVVTAASPGFSSATQTVTVTAGMPTRLAFTTAAQGIPRDTCSTAVELRVEDAFGKGVALQSAEQVDLTVMGVPVTVHPA